MPSDEEKILRKINKYQEKLDRRRRRRHIDIRDQSEIRSPLDNHNRHFVASPEPQSPPLLIPSPTVSPNVEEEAVEVEVAPPLEINAENSSLLEQFKQVLGNKEDPKQFEGIIQEDIANCFKNIIINGLSKEDKEGIYKENKIPENCMILDAPLLNEEVNSVLTESSKNRDKAIAYQQRQLGLATGIIGQVMTKLMINKNTDVEIFKSLSDATKLLNDLNQQQTKTRRILMAPLLDKNFNHMIEKTKRDKHLYGENLMEVIKTSKQVQQSSISIAIQHKKPAPKPITTNNPKIKTAVNKNGPPQRKGQYQTTRAMARGGPSNRGTRIPSQQYHRPAHNSERMRGAYNRR